MPRWATACEGATFEDGPPEPGPLSAVCRAAANATHWVCYAEYKVGRAECEAGVTALLQQMASHGLIDVRSDG